MNKPPWLNKKIDLSTSRNVQTLLKRLNLHTVCEEALCPNLSECFKEGVATFMILGDTCTRACTFCAIKKGAPLAVDANEPQQVCAAVARLQLKHVVITSPTRDDLEDYGATHFYNVVKEVRQLEVVERIEVLIPDFCGVEACIRKVLDSKPDIVAHNLETVPSLYSRVRPDTDYERSLRVLRLVKEHAPYIYTKSALMLGVGESDSEVFKVLTDLRKVKCDFLSMGQYLPPSRNHYPCRYIEPEKFHYWYKVGIDLGFKAVLSSPYVRSSYLAHTYISGL